MNIIKKKPDLLIFNKSKFLDNRKFPTISVITVVKNSQRFLDKTIKSVIHQTYRNFEYIIIDGNSTDNTQSIVNKYKKHINIYLRIKDKNLWEAMNLGIKLANGSIIVFLNSDDTFSQKALNYAANYFKNNKNLDFLFGTVFKHWLKSGFYPFRAYWTFNFYTTHSVGFFVKKKVHKKIGLYNENFLSADLDLFLRIIFSKKFIGMGTKENEFFGNFRLGGFSSKVKYKTHLRDLNQIRLNNNQSKFYVFLIYLYKILKNPKKFIFNLK